MQLDFYEIGVINEKEVTFAVVHIYQDKWVYVRHKERMTWEIPGVIENEEIMKTGKRELFEETGDI